MKVPGEPTLKTIARELMAIVRKNVTIDWTIRENVRAQLQVLVKRILRKYGYPPDKQEPATQTVLQQAELFGDEWAMEAASYSSQGVPYMLHFGQVRGGVMEETKVSRWEQLRARQLADPAAQASYERKRDTLIALRRILQAIDGEREQRQLSKAALAHIAGLQPAAVRRLLTAEGSNPTLHTVIGVADALGLEIELRPKSANISNPAAGQRPHHRGPVTASR